MCDAVSNNYFSDIIADTDSFENTRDQFKQNMPNQSMELKFGISEILKASCSSESNCEKRNLTMNIRSVSKSERSINVVECDICLATFSSTGSMLRHRRIHYKERHLSCPHCDKQYVRRDQLFSHCITHINERHREMFCCPLRQCEFMAMGYSNISLHFSASHEELCAFHCKNCPANFKNFRRLWMHYHLFHGLLVEQRSQILEEQLNMKMRDTEKKQRKRCISNILESETNENFSVMKKNYNEYEIRETANVICEEYEKKRDSVELSDITADQEEDCCLHALSSEEGSAVLEPDSRELIVRGTSFDVPISHSSSALPAPDCFTCDHCGIVYIDYLLWLLHMSFHSRTGDPLKCALCGVHSSDRYEFAAHVYSTSHFLK